MSLMRYVSDPIIYPGFDWEEQEAWKFGHSHDPLQQTNLQQRIIPMDKVS